MGRDPEESIAKRWLEGQGFSDIIDLSRENRDPPDFRVENRIGVEVRRLESTTEAMRPDLVIKTIEHSLSRIIINLLEEAGEPPGGYTVYVRCETSGAPPKRKETEKIVREAIDQCLQILNEALRLGEKPKWPKWRFASGLRLRFSAYIIPGKRGKFEFMWPVAHADERGWELADSVRNINHSIVTKTRKIEDKIHCYTEWWLVLVENDFWTPGDWETDRWQWIRDNLIEASPWSRVVVIKGNARLTFVELI